MKTLNGITYLVHILGTDKKDNTIAKVKLPNTGVTVAVAISIVALAGTAVVLKVKKDKYKGI